MKISLALLATPLLCMNLSAADDFQTKVAEGKSVDVLHDGVVVARFMTEHDASTPERQAETFKPYLHVFDPTGAIRLTKGPGGLYPHHHGLFVGFNMIHAGGQTYDRWHMIGGDQITRKVSAEPGEKAKIVADVEWEGAKGAPALLDEKRTMTLFTPPKPFYLGIDITTSLEPPQGEAELNGDLEHAGVQFRPSEKIDGAKTVFLYPGEKVDIHTARDLPWVAEVMTIEGKTFTVVVLNPPDNPKGTIYSAYRDYGRFGAFVPGTAKAGAPFTLHYRWLIAEGDVRDPAIFQKAWNDYSGKELPTPALTTGSSQPRPGDAPTTGK